MREAQPHRIFAHELRDKNDTHFNRFLPQVKQIEVQLSFYQYLVWVRIPFVYA